MSASAGDQGVCPSCGAPGEVGDACAERVCGRWGFRFIPARFVTWGQREPPPPLVGRTVGKALMVRVLGAGGFGTVYLGLQLPVLMEVAVKLLHRHDDPLMLATLLKKFEGEARALARLNHPNVVRLVDYGEQEGSPYLIMEYVPGSRTLKSEIAERALKGEGVRAAEARTILRQTVDGLAAAHAAGFLHRDVKPENLMLQAVEGNPLLVRIVDFGLAKFTEERTSSSKAMGTPAYMAPEQLLQRDLGPWTDLYAVGAVAFELLTGRRPYPGRTSQEIIAKKVDPAYDPLSRVSDLPLPELTRAFLKRALSRDTAERFRGAQAFREALDLAMDAFADGFDSSTGSLDVSGLLDSSDLARVGAEKRKLEEEKKRLAEEKARLDEERRRFDEERRALAATGVRPRLVEPDDGQGTRPLDEPPGPVPRPAPKTAPRPGRSVAITTEAEPSLSLELGRRRPWLGYGLGLGALLLAAALAAAAWLRPADPVAETPSATEPLVEALATVEKAPAPTPAAAPVEPAPEAPAPEPAPTPEPVPPVPVPAPAPAPVVEPAVAPVPAPVAVPTPARDKAPAAPRVRMSSDPEGAVVIVNGHRKCTTPCAVRFEGKAPYEVRVELEAFAPWVRTYATRAAVEKLAGRLHVRLEMD